MKTRTTSRWKAKKRRGCWANKFKMATASSPVNNPFSVDTPELDNVNNINNVHIFHDILNRSAEKISAKHSYNQCDVSNSTKTFLEMPTNSTKPDHEIADGYSSIQLSQLRSILHTAALCSCKIETS